MNVSSYHSVLPSAASRLLPEELVIGRPALAGSVAYDAREQSYRLIGGGTNMWMHADEAQIVARRLAGDGLVRARARFVGEDGHAHRKIGVTWRAGVEAGARHVSVVAHADGLTSLQFRREDGAKTEQIVSPLTGADVLQLERRGRDFVMSVARFGLPWVETVLRDGPELGDEAWVGLFVCSHEAEATMEAHFDNVRVFRTAPPELKLYREFLPSELELLDPATGCARVVHREEGELQSPNWAPDGESIDCNRAGLIERFDLRSGELGVVPSGEATNNNNDHVLSPDGRWFGTSHRAAERGCLVYVLPAEGGAPRLVTEHGPSYLHGWSPDGRSLIYTAKRPETGTALNIYRIAAEGGAEERLSDGPGLDDGSEYSPDGAWIYFNSDRTGVMKIWRMRPDGSGVEQVTHDGLNDWFPHVSPDGLWLVFISYQADVPAREHPFYKHVYLRRCALGATVGAGETSVSEPTVIAYVYGGQGTFNVPSWSPDSRCVAFISNGGVA